VSYVFMVLTEHNGVQLIRMPGHGVLCNELADISAEQPPLNTTVRTEASLWRLCLGWQPGYKELEEQKSTAYSRYMQCSLFQYPS
jgi:hypothetical protein